MIHRLLVLWLALDLAFLVVVGVLAFVPVRMRVRR